MVRSFCIKLTLGVPALAFAFVTVVPAPAMAEGDPLVIAHRGASRRAA